jgi:hypothetical protein
MITIIAKEGILGISSDSKSTAPLLVNAELKAVYAHCATNRPLLIKTLVAYIQDYR